MLLKDRVMLITNVEKFAGHGTTHVALAQGATVLAHDPSFEAAAARHKYESRFPGAQALPVGGRLKGAISLRGGTSAAMRAISSGGVRCS